MENLNVLVNPISEQKREKYLTDIYPKKTCRDFPGWLPSNAGGMGLIPGWRAKIPYASQPLLPAPKNIYKTKTIL